MILINNTFIRMICPICRHQMRADTPDFGPEKIQCFYCNSEIETGLKPFSKLQFRQKIFTILKEIFAPSSELRKYSLTALCIVALGIPILGFIVGALKNINIYSLFIMLCLLSGFAFYFYTIIRIILMIVESGKYSKRGEKPIWK